jgi:hypothetical protein
MNRSEQTKKLRDVQNGLPTEQCEQLAAVLTALCVSVNEVWMSEPTRAGTPLFNAVVELGSARDLVVNLPNLLGQVSTRINEHLGSSN